MGTDTAHFEQSRFEWRRRYQKALQQLHRWHGAMGAKNPITRGYALELIHAGDMIGPTHGKLARHRVEHLFGTGQRLAA